MKRLFFQMAALIVICITLASCGAQRRAERERRHKEKMDKLDEDKKKFEQQNPR